MENWKGIVDYEGLYQVSDLGRVRSLDREVWSGKSFYEVKGRVLKSFVASSGYLQLRLSKSGISFNYMIHALVLDTFIPVQPGKEHLVRDHINNNKLDNRLINLQRITRRENNTKDSVSKCKAGVKRSNSRINPFVATIKNSGDSIHLGYFKSEDEAHRAYLGAVKDLECGKEIKIKKASFPFKEGVTRSSSKINPFRSAVKLNGKRINLGNFNSDQLAHEACLKAKALIDLGLHPKTGEKLSYAI